MLRVSRRLGTRRPVDGRAVGDPAPADMSSEGDVDVPAAEADPVVPVSDPDTARTKDADSTSGVGVHKNDAFQRFVVQKARLQRHETAETVTNDDGVFAESGIRRNSDDLFGKLLR